jgi:glyoxylase-like metal-dependent hydrolase (beta-lactamase superfamily II)
MITLKSFITNYFSENTYLVYDETGEAVLIDCGCIREEEERELECFVRKNNLTIKRYLCTHLHLDHVFGNEYVFNTYGLNPEAHKSEVELTPSLKEQAALFSLPVVKKEIPVERCLMGGEVIRFGNSELKALLVPGHSPGSLAFYNEKNGYLFAGDVLFRNSVGRTDLWGGNHEMLIAAIHDKLLLLPDETIVCPGHGPHTTLFAEKMNNPYL